MSNAEKVYEFMLTYGQDTTGAKAYRDMDTFLTFRDSLVDEEREELKEAIDENSRVGMLDASLDKLYFEYGTALGLGFTPEQIDAGFAEVHASNMSKLGEDGKPIYREDGKVLKGPNYFKPDLAKFI